MKCKRLIALSACLAGILLAGCAAEAPPAAESLPQAGAGAGLAAGSEAPASEGGAAPEKEAPLPVGGNRIQDGTYAIEVSSSSSMFRIVDAQLTAEGGELSAVLTLSGTGYEKLYMGTAAQALSDTDGNCIYFAEDADGKYTYQVPVTALDQETACAAWSIKKKKWYDRTLVFQSSSLPAGALLPVTAAAEQMPADGQYRIEVTLSGGSGRAEIESPAVLTVKDGTATADIIFGSPYYESVKADGILYQPNHTEENSAFRIPVLLDRNIAVSAQTIAMSEPHEIDYTLYFDSRTMKPMELQ